MSGVESAIVPQWWMDGAWRMFVRPPYKLADRAYPSEAPPDRSGVYFLWTGETRLLYVGRATRMDARLLAHWKAKRVPFDSYSCLPAPATLLPLIEAPYIEALDPCYNRKPELSRWAGHARMTRLIARLWGRARIAQGVSS